MRADARRNLAKIVEAAASVMAERGVSAPMELIARRAGVGVGTLYRRFPDRGALVAAVAEHYVESLAEALDRAAAEAPDAWQGLRAFALWAGDPGRGALAAALAELPEETYEDRAAFVRARGRWLERLGALVRRAQAGGLMRADVGTDDVVAALNLFACHPEALPAHVAARPVRFLELMLDGMKAGTPV
ncbi:TetR/AcrR family transcriptional regulator [Nonomuraea sp. SBT364]|uniref:TetR/AcrR family transcriptional regulator n=1 Tax=Nonomuraea sp. SBT364 TaxID=1580530 RepID=UPI00066D176F|nr:TetR/AcrR family transcriptional regulator [Nonomuraea sp. SBT364]